MTRAPISETTCFGGRMATYGHASAVLGCDMQYSVFTPPQADSDNLVPVIWYLSGLTCTEENATVKAGFQRVAAELGIMVVCPDTSPRGRGEMADSVADDESYDLGQGAGFYVNAVEAPWANNFAMYDYIVNELPAELVASGLPVDMFRQSIMGHSMGGHGALTIGLKNPDVYKSISAFAPIVAPMQCPWGQKALKAYLGEDSSKWAAYDACALVNSGATHKAEILIDQGLDDPFLKDQLKPELFVAACHNSGQTLNLRRHAGYDHSYFFISSFIEDHLRHHAKYLHDETGN